LFLRLTCAKSSSVGAALGNIMAAVITHHIGKISSA
jgi:hypothetical protein